MDWKSKERERKGEEKENEPAKEQVKANETNKGKAPLSEKRPSMIDIGNSLRKKRKSSKPT